MNRFWIPLVAFAALCVVFGVALKRAPEKQFVKSALLDKPAPDFVLPDLLKPGSTVDSRQFRGRWMLMNVWGTWCAQCRVEHEQLLTIQRSGKVALVGLNYKDNDEAARSWLAELGNPFDVIAVDRQSHTALDYGVYGAPESFLVNPEGIIVHKVVSVLTPEIWRDKLLPLIDGAAK
jgi:cytochrome c biogenesis protein CcmG, thiol:disulfide interchange protein DsbE